LVTQESKSVSALMWPMVDSASYHISI